MELTLPRTTGSPSASQPAPVLSETTAFLLKMVRAYHARTTLPIMFDIETTGLSPQRDRIVALQFMQPGYAPVILDMRQLKGQEVARILSPLFDGQFLIVGHNLKFDLSFLKAQLGLLPTKVWDTMIAEQVLFGLGKSDASKQGISFSLQACAKRRGIEMSKEERNWFIGLNDRPEWDAPFPPEQLEYMAEDVRVLDAMFQDQYSRLTGDGPTESPKMSCAYLEMRVIPALVEMELAGVLVDQEAWRDVIAEKEEEARGYEEEVYRVFGPPILQARTRKFDEAWEPYSAWEQARDLEAERIGCKPLSPKMKGWKQENPPPHKPKRDESPPNIGSVTQLMDAFGVLGIPAQDTSSQSLEDLKDEFPAVGLLLKWRKAIKFSQSFGESLLEKIGPDGRLHPDYQQIGASSMRMSCTQPNFQQIPSKGDGKRLRACIKAGPGNVLLVADYSSQELRILADLSGDETMLRMFREDVDLHSETARIMFDLGSEINPKKYEIVPGVDARSAAKTINYGIAYGMSAAALALRLGVSRDRGEELMASWFRTYPGVQRWLSLQRQRGVRDGAIGTVCGWVRPLGKLPPKPVRHRGGSWEDYKALSREWRAAKSRIERQSMNTPIQGAAAGITKLALVNFFDRCVLNNGNRVHVIAVVHDEFVVECHEDVAGSVSGQLADAMDSAFRFYCPNVHNPCTEVVVSPYWRKE